VFLKSNVVIVALILSLGLAGFPLAAFADDVEIPDKNLERVIRAILKKKQIEKEKISDEDLRSIYFLEAMEEDIENLSGLEHCLNLASVDLSKNKIADVSPLAACTNIQLLDLSKNRIKDISSLSSLEKLQYLQLEDNDVANIDAVASLKAMNSLYLSRNQISNISPVKGLSKVWSLYLSNNKVKDVSPVKELKWLSNLDLQGNEVEDVSPLESLTELRWTFLQENQIKDVSPLLRMAKADLEDKVRFAPFWNLYVGGNPLSEDAATKQIAELKKIGVRVRTKEDEQREKEARTKELAQQAQ